MGRPGRGPVGVRSLPAAFLLDLSNLEIALSAVELTWAVGSGDFVGKFRVEASDDLDNWRTVVASATLARLRTSGQTVLVDVIELPSVKARYLKIQQLDGSEGFALVSEGWFATRQQRTYKINTATPGPDMQVVFDPRFDYARGETKIEITEQGAVAVGAQGERLTISISRPSGRLALNEHRYQPGRAAAAGTASAAIRSDSIDVQSAASSPAQPDA